MQGGAQIERPSTLSLAALLVAQDSLQGWVGQTPMSIIIAGRRQPNPFSPGPPLAYASFLGGSGEERPGSIPPC